MTARLILKYPDSRLRIRSEEVIDEDWDVNVKKWCTDISDTMKANAGLGLAAPQVGIHKRIFAIDINDLDNLEIFQQEPRDGTLFFINPVLEITEEKTVSSSEACLSVPGVMYNVKRKSSVDIFYTTLEREKKHIRILGKDAVIIQHEYDHLDGKLFIDHLNPFDKKDFLKKNRVPKKKVSEAQVNQIREQRRAKARNMRKRR